MTPDQTLRTLKQRVDGSYFLGIPNDIVQDISFPFKKNWVIDIQVKGKEVVLSVPPNLEDLKKEAARKRK